MAIVFIVILTIVLIIALGTCINTQYILVKGCCGKEYYVCKKFANGKGAADILCEVNTRCNKLIWYLSSLNHSAKKRLQIKKLEEEYDWDDLIESEKESYNVDKGAKIYLCLRDKRTGQLYDINTIMFVVIHELSHIITTKWDLTSNHSPEFWDNNVFLLKESIKLNIYEPVDYSRYPMTYCGIYMDSSPLF